jgi:hypothetical protein
MAGQCVSYHSATPYKPLVEALQRHCGIADGDQAESINLKLHQVLQEMALEGNAVAPYLCSLLGVCTGMEMM